MFKKADKFKSILLQDLSKSKTLTTAVLVRYIVYVYTLQDVLVERVCVKRIAECYGVQCYNYTPYWMRVHVKPQLYKIDLQKEVIEPYTTM